MRRFEKLKIPALRLAKGAKNTIKENSLIVHALTGKGNHLVCGFY
jgi:hypothetical protein